jgi:hypothetical protein
MAKALILLTVATLAIGTAFMGYSGAEETEATTPEMSNPEPVSEPAETAAEPEPIAEPTETWDETAGETEVVTSYAEELVNEQCTFCHDVDRVYKADLSLAGWEVAIDRMTARGAWLGKTERDVVIEYLASF